MPDLIFIYGPPLAGKSTLARALGRAMPGKTGIVSVDHLLNEAIAQADRDRMAEIELVHQQVRLLVANYLKFRYHCIVEGPFVLEHEGIALNFESQIDQLMALMRMMTVRRMIVRLSASEEDLARRAEQTGREVDLAVALRATASYKPRIAMELRAFDTGVHTTDDIVRSILEDLPGMPRGQA